MTGLFTTIYVINFLLKVLWRAEHLIFQPAVAKKFMITIITVPYSMNFVTKYFSYMHL